MANMVREALAFKSWRTTCFCCQLMWDVISPIGVVGSGAGGGDIHPPGEMQVNSAPSELHHRTITATATHTHTQPQKVKLP